MLVLGVCLERLGRDRRATETLERHEQRFGESRRAAFHRALAVSRLGDRTTAHHLLRRAARPPEKDERLSPEDALIRARARVALLTRGRPG